MRTVSILLSTAIAQRRLGKPDLRADLLGKLFSLLVEHQENELGLAAALGDVIQHLLVLEHVIVDVLDGGEFRVRGLRRAENIRMTTVITVYIADIFKVFYPLIDTQQIEIRGADEIDRLFVAMEEPSDFRNILQLLPSRHRQILHF